MNPVLNAPLGADGLPMPVDPSKVQDFFEDFYEDIFLELDKFGEVEHLCVCDNLADHMVGNVYIKFRDEDGAARALQGFQGRYYAGKPIQVEFSPVTDFRESTCRQYEEGTCGRGGYCNFMHVRPVAKELRKQLFGRYKGGSGGSTRFHDGEPRRGGGGGGGGFGDRRRAGGGGGGYGGDRDRRRYDDNRRGGGRYDDDRGRNRYGRDDRDRGGRDRDRARDDSAERRARIAQWNADTPAAAPAAAPASAIPSSYGGGYGAQPAEQGYGGGGYPQAPGAPQQPGGYGSYAAPPQQQDQQQQQQYGGYQQCGNGGGGGGGGGGRHGGHGSLGGSGANTIPIAGMRTFPNPDQQHNQYQ